MSFVPWTAGALLVALVGCGGPAPTAGATDPAPPPVQVDAKPDATPAVSPAQEGPEMENVELSWSMDRAAGDTLVIRYALTNRTSERVYALVELARFGATQGVERAPDAMIVRAGDSADTVRFIRGYVPPQGLPMVRLLPGARGVAPGETLTGEARLALPLRTWHPNEESRTLPGTPQRATLEIGVLTGDLPWYTQPLLDGSKLTIPDQAAVAERQRFVRGEALAIP